MTLINQNSTVTHNGNGVTTQWPYTFIIPDADSARVGLFEIATSVLTEIPDTDYSITGLGDSAGGEVTYPLVGSPVAATHRVVIWREVEYTQDTELTNQTPYYPTVLEDQLDRIVMQIQQLAADMGRAITVTLGSGVTPDEFVADLQQGAADAQASATAAAASASAADTSADAAAASAASINLPADPTPLYMLRRNAADTAYEERSPAQVASDISAVRYDADQGLTLAQQAQGQENIGAFGWKKDAKTIDYTVVAADNGGVITVDATASNRTITLPAAATAGAGFKIIIKKIDSTVNAVIIDGNAAETIDGATTRLLYIQHQSIALFCDGSAWFVMSEGTVFARGSNANGNYVRYSDGTQVCYHKQTNNGAISTAYMGGFRSSGFTWTFPIAFSSAPTCVPTVQFATAFGITTAASTTTNVQHIFTAVASQAAADLTAELFAIGRWF